MDFHHIWSHFTYEYDTIYKYSRMSMAQMGSMARTMLVSSIIIYFTTMSGPTTICLHLSGWVGCSLAIYHTSQQRPQH